MNSRRQLSFSAPKPGSNHHPATNEVSVRQELVHWFMSASNATNLMQRRNSASEFWKVACMVKNENAGVAYTSPTTVSNEVSAQIRPCRPATT